MVALSGGVDSSVLLALAHKTIPGHVVAITAATPFVASDEIAQARMTARALGVEHVVARIPLLKNSGLTANTRTRCYICKHQVFRHMRKIAQEHRARVMDASNYSDTRDFRPGLEALRELGVISPFIIARMTKPEIRALAKQNGLAVWNKPANACLATRIPYGTRITPRLLKRIEQAEKYLRRLGMHLVRVRDHGAIARIEVDPEDFQRVLDHHRKIVRFFHTLGYAHAAIDLDGYRTGSLITENMK